MRWTFIIIFYFVSIHSRAQQTLPTGTVRPTRQTPVHDPVMIREKNSYYIFATGFGISVWSSKDLKTWTKEAPVFSKAPQWALDTIPGFKGHIWAPDIIFHNGLYYLYYFVSAFGKNTSAIGVATNSTLDPSSAEFNWVDHGPVIQSWPGKNNWNAIDPNLVIDDKGQAYMTFGSFWDGIKMVRLSKDFLRTAEPLTSLPTIASRKTYSSSKNPPAVDNNPVDAGGNAIEAPFIFRKGKYYYLFASIDYCCKGERSTYKVIVGRSESINGPFLDKEGRDLAQGGGTIVLQGNKDWHGVGHNAVYSESGKDYMIFHGYDAADKGRSKLQIKRIQWDEHEWPIVIQDEDK
jgi:arabinan endo-1,5-alpha-L-arabinosidase